MNTSSLAKTSLILLAALSVSADEFHWNRTSGNGNWHDTSNWTDADGNSVSSYPGENGTTDVAVFHGMGMSRRVYINVPLDLACVRFEDGNTTFCHTPTEHFHADRFEFSDHATFGYMEGGPHYGAFLQPDDFTIGNRSDLLVNDGVIRGTMNYQNQASGNWGSRLALGIDTDGKLLTGQGSRQNDLNMWSGDTTHSNPYGLFFGMWGDFRSVSFKNAGTWTLTIPSGLIATENQYGAVGRPSDNAQGTVTTGIEPLYFWPRYEENKIQTNYFRAKILAPTFLQCGSGCTVLFDDHSTETCAYEVTAGILQLGGGVCNNNDNQPFDPDKVENWNCPLGTGPVHVRWDGTLHVASANVFNAHTALFIHSFRDRGRNKNATNVIRGQIIMDEDGTVRYLTIDDRSMLPGTYGSSASGADIQRDDIFSGPGVLTVLACEGGATCVLLK